MPTTEASYIPQPEAAYIPLHTFNAAKDILETVGFPEEDRYGFARHITKVDNYWSGTFEWSERECGLKIYIHKSTDNVIYRINVIQDGFFSDYSAEDFARVNEELKALFG